MKRTLQIAVLGLLVAGCQSVPATKVAVDLKTGAVAVKSPKDIEVKGLKVTKRGEDVDVTIDSYSSKNSPDVIAAVAQSNASMADSAAKLSKIAIDATIQAAAKAALP